MSSEEHESSVDVRLALLALDEMRLLWQAVSDVGDYLDQKANLILGASGIVLALLVAQSIPINYSHVTLKLIVVVLAVLVHGVVIIMALRAANPVTYNAPLDSCWTTLDELIFRKPEREAILTIVSGYVDQINYNSSINDRKATHIDRTLRVLYFVIVLVVLAILLP